MMRTLFNVLWVVFGGWLAALGWLIAAVIMAITVIGLPWARACLMIAGFVLWPYGREAVSRKLMTGRDDIGTGTLGTLGNVVWFVLAGVWLALGHVALAISLGITIVGIPFAWAHLKIAAVALVPVGKMIVTRHEAEEARRRAAVAAVDRAQGISG